MKVKKDTDRGILYILIVKIGDIEVYKVGVTSRKIEDRVCEIATSFFHSYRYFPYIYPKKFTTVDAVYNKEAQMHNLLKEYRYEPKHKFSGSTEFFVGVPLDTVLDLYMKVIKGEDVSSC